MYSVYSNDLQRTEHHCEHCNRNWEHACPVAITQVVTDLYCPNCARDIDREGSHWKYIDPFVEWATKLAKQEK